MSTLALMRSSLFSAAALSLSRFASPLSLIASSLIALALSPFAIAILQCRLLSETIEASFPMRKTAAADVQPLDVPSYNAGVEDMRFRLLGSVTGAMSQSQVRLAALQLSKPLK